MWGKTLDLWDKLLKQYYNKNMWYVGLGIIQAMLNVCFVCA